DKTIRPFIIPSQPDIIGEILQINAFRTFDSKTHKAKERKAKISMRRKHHLLLVGPNGIGKSTLLESLARTGEQTASQKENPDAKITDGIRVGYYRQDFSTLNFDDTVYQSLIGVMQKPNEEVLRSTAAGFLITSEVMKTKIEALSEGQKGLVAFARLVLQAPGLLILDEPTNHINFRHLPVIAEALDKYDGAMILVSHVPEFVKQIRIDEVLNLEK
ncbi:MAG: ATP-binding cassette domain-containing protein, partial [bacterium]